MVEKSEDEDSLAAQSSSQKCLHGSIKADFL